MNTPLKVRPTVNVKALLILLIGFTGLGVAVHLAHGQQVRRNARALLTQADQAEGEGRPEQAADYLSQYLGMMPADTDVLSRYALLLVAQAKTPRARFHAFSLLEQVLRRDGSRSDVRRQAARTALQVGNFSGVRHHVEVLLGENPADPELLGLMARCEVADRAYANAVDWYAKALEHDHGQVELCVEYATLLRERMEAAAQATGVIERMLQANGRSVTARLAAARHYQRGADWEQAEESIQVALTELGAQEAEVFLLAAVVAQARGKGEQARVHLQRGLGHHPQDGRLLQGLARLDVKEQRRDEALARLGPMLKVLPRDPEALWQLGNLLVDLDRSDEVERVAEQLRRNHPWLAGWLQARQEVGKKAWGKARQTLERLASLKAPSPAATQQAELLLARCHEALGNPDGQLRACRQAVKSDSSSLEARRALAAALVQTGQLEEAIREYQRVAKRLPEVRLDLAQLLLERNLRLPKEEQRWDELNNTLKEVPPSQKDEEALLRARVLTTRGQVDEARKLMIQVRDRDLKKLKPWLFLLGLARQQGPEKAYLALLAEAEQQVGPRAEWSLARAGQLITGPAEQARKGLAKLEAEAERFQGSERDRVLEGLGQGYLTAADPKGAARLWGELAQRQPADLGVRFRLLELAYRESQGSELAQMLEEVRRIEGPGGVVTAYGEAAGRVLRARGGEKAAAEDARRHLEQAARLRPSWSAVPLLDAEAYEAEGRPDKALERYQAALELGEGRLRVVRRVLQLLADQGRYAEAQTLLKRLPEQAISSGGLARFGAQLTLLSLEGGEDPAAVRQRALAAARKTVAAETKDYRERLWLGQMAVLAGEHAEAAKEFRRARDLAEKEPEPWVALILHLARTDAKKAEVELASAGKKLPKEQAPLVLAAGYEGLGRLEDAEKQYEALARSRPNDPTVLQAAARFHSRMGQAAKAEPLLRKLLLPETRTLEGVAGWARQILAVNLAQGGTQRQFKEALALVPERKGAAVEERRTRALVLASRPAHRREAITLFEGLSPGRSAPAPEVRFQLARLYEADGKWDRAQAHYRALVAENEKNPIYLAAYVRALLRHDQAEEAQPWQAQLEKLGPPTFEIVELRAWLLHATDRKEEARRLVRGFARQKGARLDFVALLLEQLGDPVEAERLFRAYAEATKGPGGRLLLAQHLARRDQLSEALKLCEGAWRDSPPEIVGHISLYVVRTAREGPKQMSRVEGWIKAAMAKHPQSGGLLVLLAELEDMRGRHEEAIALYRRVLEKSPRNVAALNNLAYLLALKEGQHEEALSLIESALEEAGPHAELLDTRAVVHLKAGRAGPAESDLRQAVLEQPAALTHLHLAEALLRREYRAEARQALRKAREAGLKEADLHPLERDSLRQLAAELEGA